MKKNDEIKIKFDSEYGYVIIDREKEKMQKRFVMERKECKTCQHLKKAKIVQEGLIKPETNLEPIGVCTLGTTWRVVYHITLEQINCAKVTSSHQ